MMPEPASHPFVKYVSGVAGHHVERYGTGTVIGGRRQPAPAGTGSLDTKAVSLEELMTQRGAGRLEIDGTVIVALTAEEWATNWKAYGRALRKGALRERKAAEYWAMVDAQEERRKTLRALLQELEKLSPGASAHLPKDADEISLREAIDAAKAAGPLLIAEPGQPLPAIDAGEGEPLPELADETLTVGAAVLHADGSREALGLVEGETDG